MNPTFTSKSGLVAEHISIATKQALADIEEGRTGKQLHLKTRHPKINQVMLGGFRFGNQYAICGMSGSCKSFYANLLYQDFCDPALNSGFTDEFDILHFNLEMSGSTEVIRKTSSRLAIPYSDLISAFKPLSDSAMVNVRQTLDEIATLNIWYVEAGGNVPQIKKMVHDFKAQRPTRKLIVGIDHTLLAEYYQERSEVELVSALSNMFLKLRKELGIMGILICQLNTEIEKDDRMANPANHYPKRLDIHGSKAVYRDADWVIVLHAPELLGIQEYGRNKYQTTDLLAWHLLKGRNAPAGVVARLKRELEHGRIVQWNENDGDQFTLDLSADNTAGS